MYFPLCTLKTAMEVVDDDTEQTLKKLRQADHNVLTSELRVRFHQGRQTSASHHHTSLIPGSIFNFCLGSVVVVVVCGFVVVVFELLLLFFF